MPREITLHDNTLLFRPAEEMKQLREGRLASVAEAAVQAGESRRLKTAGPTGQIEVVCRVTPGERGAAGIELKDRYGNPARFYYDAKASELCLEFGSAQYDGDELSVQKYKVPMKLPAGGAELRLFYDRSVIEAYSEGLCTMVRWYPDNPDGLEVSLFSENAGTTFSDINVWRLGTIWKDYIGE
jgi:sucrose-6-phosphate hydrolase SacC (GH32 family)